MAKLFSQPEINPPFGLSDHSTVLLNPNERTLAAMSTRKQIFVRDKRQSKKDSLARYLLEIVKIGMNNMPIKSITKFIPKTHPG